MAIGSETQRQPAGQRPAAMRNSERSSQRHAIDCFDARHSAAGKESENRVHIVWRAPCQTQHLFARCIAPIRCRAGLAKRARAHPVMLDERCVEATQARIACCERDIGDGDRRVGQQLLGQQQALRSQVCQGGNAMDMVEDAPQMPVSHAQTHRERRQHRIQALVGGLAEHRRRPACERMRRVHQRQTGRLFGAAAQAWPETMLLGERGIGEKAAVLAHRRPDLANRPAIDAGRCDADKKSAVKSRVAGLKRQVSSVIVEQAQGRGSWHGAMIGKSRLATRRFRTCGSGRATNRLRELRKMEQQPSETGNK